MGATAVDLRRSSAKPSTRQFRALRLGRFGEWNAYSGISIE
jgi:hypothetical protein